MDRVNLFCILASYSCALSLDALNQFRPRHLVRWLGIGFGVAGLVAQTIYLLVQRPPLVWQYGWMLSVAWILGMFYLYGALHYRKLAWGVFVLPLVLGLVTLAWLFGQAPPGGISLRELFSPHEVWTRVHVTLLFLATVAVCVGFVASLMYLFQAHRLKAKTLPGRGMQLLSLERLERMNRWGIDLAFPLLTVGIAIGAAKMAVGPAPHWDDLRVWGTAVTWLALALVVYLRYGLHLRGRQVAVWTIVVFVLLLCSLFLAHPSGVPVDDDRVVAGGAS